MTALLLAGIALAACSALCNSSGIVLEKLASSRLPVIHARHTLHLVKTLFRSPLWIVGFLLLLAGLGAQVLALTLAPISIAQTVSACGIVFLLGLSHEVLGDRLGPLEYVGIALVCVALLLLGLSVDPRHDRVGTGATFASLVLAAGPAVCVSLGLFAAAERIGGDSLRRSRLRACVFGVASGLVYGVAGLAVKWLATIVQRRGVFGAAPHALASPALYMLIACSVVGFLIFQTALQRSVASLLVPVNNVVGSAFFITAGGLVFHESLPRAVLPLVLRMAAFATLLSALVVLAVGARVAGRSQGREGELAERPAGLRPFGAEAVPSLEDLT